MHKFEKKNEILLLMICPIHFNIVLKKIIFSKEKVEKCINAVSMAYPSRDQDVSDWSNLQKVNNTDVAVSDTHIGAYLYRIRVRYFRKKSGVSVQHRLSVRRAVPPNTKNIIQKIPILFFQSLHSTLSILPIPFIFLKYIQISQVSLDLLVDHSSC